MKSTLAFVGAALCVFCALQVSAVEVAVQGNYYDSKANAWAEGTISSVGPDGRVTLKGYESPYASHYSTFHRDYYALPEAERENRRAELVAKYRDRLAYSPYTTPAKDYSFSISNHDKFTVYDESPRYGHSYESWKYTTPKTYTYSDLHQGDRVVVGYDSANPSSVYSMYRVQNRDGVDVKADIKIK